MSKIQSRVAVVAVDFGSSGDDAVVQALQMLAEGSVGTLHAVHVLDPRDVIDDPEQPALATEEEVLARAPSILTARIERIAGNSGLGIDLAKIHTHARIGRAPEAIHQVAIDYDADLIIVGTHGRRGIDRLVLGSVAETLVRTARCPVLVARPKDYGGLPKSERPDRPYAPGEQPRSSRPPHDVPGHITTQEVSWSADEGTPTGFRIV